MLARFQKSIDFLKKIAIFSIFGRYKHSRALRAVCNVVFTRGYTRPKHVRGTRPWHVGFLYCNKITNTIVWSNDGTVRSSVSGTCPGCVLADHTRVRSMGSIGPIERRVIFRAT